MWNEENYRVNLPGVNNPGAALTITQEDKELHNQLINGNIAQSTVAENQLAGDNVPLLERTREWHRSVAGIRFWRFTSLMGLDFFNHRNTRVEFVRTQDQAIYHPNDRAQSITDSEWIHAQNMGYTAAQALDTPPTVVRVNPV